MSLSQLLNRLVGKPSLPDKWATCPMSELPLLALDLELTSLNTEQAQITSFGWLSGKLNTCDISTANHHVVRAKGDLQQSPAIHGLTQEKVQQGKKVTEVVNKLLPLLTGHIVVLHHARLDMSAIRLLATNLAIELPSIWTIDTLVLCKYLLQKSHTVLKTDSLTLGTCRRRYELPDSNDHNALDDALATLELWYACQSYMKVKPVDTLKSLLHTGAVRCY